jgi:ribosome biogenesis GTPase
VIRAHSNIYYVLVDGQEVECRPRGRFRLDKQGVLAGDLVEVHLEADDEGRIDEILPRR